MAAIQYLVSQLLACNGASDGKPVVDALVRELCQVAEVDLHPEFFHDEQATLTPQGKAVSMVTAAQCAENIERTRVFLQGINAAIRTQQVQRQGRLPLRILYAGTGPFGLLLIPLLPFFEAGSLTVTLLDIHAESLAKVKRLATYLGVDHFIQRIEQVDACLWHSHNVFDVIISETMKQGLIQEPQVSVFAHLQQFLAEDGLLIPEIIRLELWLARAGAMKQGEMPVYLGQVLQLDKTTSMHLGAGDNSVLQGSLVIPQYPAPLCDLKLTTFIQVFNEHQLLENQSQLTLPIYEKNARPVPGCELRYEYITGAYPHCEFQYQRLLEVEALPLVDVFDPNQQGIYHLKRLWQKVQHQKSARAEVRAQVAALAHDEWLLDRILIDSLGLGLEPTLEQLYRSNHLAEFEAWVLAENQDAFAPETINKVNQNLVNSLQNNNIQAASSTPLSKEQLDFWDEHGYLIVPGVLNQEVCADVRTAMWDFLGMKEQEPETWYRSSAEMKKIMVQLFIHPALDAARNNHRIQQIFKQLWQSDELMMITDRVSFNPPETERWQFPGPGMHWDVDLKAPIPFATQGLIYLTDVTEDQGAFCCVPGFHKKIDQWLSELPSGVDPAEQDWSQWSVKPIAARAGDLIVWHQALPHGSSPNRAHYPRMVQYINMYR